MDTTRALILATVTLLSAACTQHQTSSEPLAAIAAASVPAPAPATTAPRSTPSAPQTTPPVGETTETTTQATTPADPTIAPVPDTAPEPQPDPTATDPTVTDPTVTESTEPVEPAEPAEPAEPTAPGEPTPIELVAKLPTTRPVVVPTDVLVAVPIAPCGWQLPIPGDATAIEALLVDVDADGQFDTVTSYQAGGWRLRLALANGPTSDVAIEGVGGAGMARILGDAQVDWSVVDPSTYPTELVVQAGANASGVNLAVYGIDEQGCLFRFADEGGADLVLPIHASIGAMSGVLCDHIAGSGFLVELSALHDSGTTYDATSTQLVRDGTSLVPGAIVGHTIDSATQSTWLNQFGALTCGSTELP